MPLQRQAGLLQLDLNIDVLKIFGVFTTNRSVFGGVAVSGVFGHTLESAIENNNCINRCINAS